MPWYPSAKACPAAIKPTVQCFFPTLYQVLLFDFSSFGEKLFFCLRGYCRAIARSAVQKQPERRARMFLCSPRRRTGGEWVEVATLPHHQQAIAAQSREARCKNSRSAERGCSSVHPPNRRRMGEVVTLPHHQQAIAAQSREARCKNSRSAERGCSSVHPPPNRRRMGGGSNPAPPPTSYRHAAQSWHLT